MYHKKPKKGDTVICTDDNSEDEDLGFSGIVLKGTCGLVVGREYKIVFVDDSNVPTNDKKTWTKEIFPKIKWGWHLCLIEGKGFYGRMFLHHFKPKEQ